MKCQIPRKRDLDTTNMSKPKILVAMSGGIDSSVAASLLQQEGYEVVGVTMKFYDQKASTTNPERNCCTPEHFRDARDVAAQLGIRHYVVNYTADFLERVIEPFVANYMRGMTPSPCILCNTYLKFSKLRRFAECLGIDTVATGHYALTQFDEITERMLLMAGEDDRKDQSYFLFQLDQDQLRHIQFPLGGMTKPDIRRIASELNLAVAEKAESQEICFVPDGQYAEFIEDYLKSRVEEEPPEGGDIIRTDGTVIGRHNGIHRYTIGQRRGIGVAAGSPLYVVGLDAYRNRVIVGSKEEVFARRFYITCCNWIAIPDLEDEIEVEAKIRSRFTPATAILAPWSQRGAVVTFTEPQPAITPGQAAVFYWGDVVVGGGWIYKVDHDFK